MHRILQRDNDSRSGDFDSVNGRTKFKSDYSLLLMVVPDDHLSSGHQLRA